MFKNNANGMPNV